MSVLVSNCDVCFACFDLTPCFLLASVSRSLSLPLSICILLSLFLSLSVLHLRHTCSSRRVFLPPSTTWLVFLCGTMTKACLACRPTIYWAGCIAACDCIVSKKFCSVLLHFEFLVLFNFLIKYQVMPSNRLTNNIVLDQTTTN